MNPPLVSVAMPVHNCASTLAVAIRSILNQSYSAWELLIVDDGSTDATLSVARSFDDPRIHVMSDGRNLGLAVRLNQLIEACRGVYFARMDGDDVAYPQRLEKQVAYLQSHPDIDLLASGALFFEGDGCATGVLVSPQDHASICRAPRSGFPLVHPSWIGPTRWFGEHRYNPTSIRAQDQELLLRTHESSRFAALPEILLGYRQEALTLRKRMRARRYFARAVLRQALARGEYVWATGGLAKQLGKTLVDFAAVLSGTEQILRKRQVLPADAAQLRQWLECWSACQEDI